MTLALHGRTKDAVIVVPASTEWRPGVEAFLRGLGADDARIRRHLTLLEERAAGRRPWLRELAGLPASARALELRVTEASEVCAHHAHGAAPIH